MDNRLALLCGAGLALVPIPPDNNRPTKAPRTKGWNTPRSANNPGGYSANADDFLKCNGFNFGLYHGASNTVALDLDDLKLAGEILKDIAGISIDDWLNDPARFEIQSPKHNRGKLIYKLPPGFDCADLRQLKHDGKVIFELRSGNCQDVIVGQHPDGGEYRINGDPATIPEASPILMDMLINWDAWKSCFDSALGIEQTPPKIAPRPPQKGETLAGRLDPIKEFNQSNSVQSVLLANGYRQAGKDRFIRPGSESKAPGAVIMRNCADGIERVYCHGGDMLNDGFAHDAFDCFCLLEHGGDFNKALRWNPEITKHNQQLYKQEQANQSKPTQKQPLDFSKFSLKGQAAAMRAKMLEDKFVMNRIAIMGQATVIYAKPNTGKTLLTIYLLIRAISTGLIRGENIFYINADDTFSGLVHKLELAEKYGFHMMAPGFNEFDSRQFLNYLAALTKQGEATGKVIILDTLKKFTNLMDKQLATGFMTIGRQFVTAGGTLILLAHTNKNRDADNKVVFGGTSDIVDDVDCAFTLDEVEIDEIAKTKSVVFENIKNRGNVAREVGFTYSITEEQSYHRLLDSVKELDEKDRAAAIKAKAIADKLENNSDAIQAIIEAIEAGATLKTELVRLAAANSGITKPRLNKVLIEHCGFSYDEGHRWRHSKGDKNCHTYSQILPPAPTTAEAYQTAKCRI
jgi:archaellum biogenesis ATPase FlaH